MWEWGRYVSFLGCRDKDDIGKVKKNNMEKINWNYMIGGNGKDYVYLNFKFWW